MISLVWNYLFHSCKHEWELIREVSLIDNTEWNAVPHGTKYILQCKKCGDLKSKKL